MTTAGVLKSCAWAPWPTRSRQTSSLSWAGWTRRGQERLPAPGTRCRLRVRDASAPFDPGAEVREVGAAYDPVGWLLESGERLDERRVVLIAWRLAE